MEEITNRSLKAQRVIRKRFKTTRAEFGIDIAAGFSELFIAIDWKLDAIDGKIFAQLYNDKFLQEIIDVEVCIPIGSDFPIPPDVAVCLLPAHTMTLCSLHQGDIGDIGPAYQTIREYADANYHKLMFPVRETYLDYSSQHPVTEISWPINLSGLTGMEDD